MYLTQQKTTPSSGGQADTICVAEKRLNEAVSLLARFDPELQNPKDCVLTIAATILGRRLSRRGARSGHI